MGMFDWFKVQSVQGPWQPPQNMMTNWQTKDFDCGLHLIVLRTDGLLEQHDFVGDETDEEVIEGEEDWFAEGHPIMFGKDFTVEICHSMRNGPLLYCRLNFRDGRFYKAKKLR